MSATQTAPGRSARGARRGSANGLNTTEVREWAKAQGIEVKDRGRVPAGLVVSRRELRLAGSLLRSQRRYRGGG